MKNKTITECYCPNCKKEVLNTLSFCNYCGHKLEPVQEDIPNKSLSMDWFNIYVSLMPLFIILYILICLYNSFNGVLEVQNSTYEDFAVLGTFCAFILNLSYVLLGILTYKKLKSQTCNSVRYLLAILVVNFCLCVANTPLRLLSAIWYIPNIIYFYKRKNVFKN